MIVRSDRIRPGVKAGMMLALLLVTVTQVRAQKLDTIPEKLSDWTERGKILEHGSRGKWDDKQSAFKIAGLIKKDGKYYLYYLSGFDGCWPSSDDGSHLSMGLATSTDGLNWTKYWGNPIVKVHDIVKVTSHEEGMRNARVDYDPKSGKILAFIGVDHQNGNFGVTSGHTCSFGQRDGCACDRSVDATAAVAASDDGIHFGKFEKLDVGYSGDGDENHSATWTCNGDRYFLVCRVMQGGRRHHVNVCDGSYNGDYRKVAEKDGEWSKGWISICFLHNDNKTITVGGIPKNESDYSKSDPTHNAPLLLWTVDINDPGNWKNRRKIWEEKRFSHHYKIFKDVDNMRWMMVYEDTWSGELYLRTAPLDETMLGDEPLPQHVRRSALNGAGAAGDAQTYTLRGQLDSRSPVNATGTVAGVRVVRSTAPNRSQLIVTGADR